MKDNLNDNLIRTYRERLEIAEIYEKKMHAIIDAGKTINFNDNINEIMDSMLELAAKITNSGFASAALMGKSGRILFGYSISGEKPGALPADTDFIREKGIGGILMRTKIPYICNVPAVDKNLDEDKRIRYGIRNFVSVPILAKGNNFTGLFEVYNKAGIEIYGDNDIDLLTALGTFAAIALERHRMSSEFEKFGEEAGKVMEDVLNTELLLKDNCKKLTETRTELVELNGRIKKAAVLAELIGNSDNCGGEIGENVRELKKILSGRD